MWERNSISSHIVSHQNNFKWQMMFIEKQCKFSQNSFMPFMKFVAICTKFHTNICDIYYLL